MAAGVRFLSFFVVPWRATLTHSVPPRQPGRLNGWHAGREDGGGGGGGGVGNGGECPAAARSAVALRLFMIAFVPQPEGERSCRLEACLGLLAGRGGGMVLRRLG